MNQQTTFLCSMAQTSISMTHTTETIIALNAMLFLAHFLGKVFIICRVLLVVLSLLYVIYNLRVQIVAAGGFKNWFKNFVIWKQ
jgi:hypothetical protein